MNFVLRVNSPEYKMKPRRPKKYVFKGSTTPEQQSQAKELVMDLREKRTSWKEIVKEVKKQISPKFTHSQLVNWYVYRSTDYEPVIPKNAPSYCTKKLPKRSRGRPKGSTSTKKRKKTRK